MAAAAHAARGDGLRAVPIAHAAVGASAGLELGVGASALRGAEVARRDVDAASYLADFGMTAGEVGITEARVSIVSTDLDGALAEVIDEGEHCIVIWDGVAYRLEAA